MRHAWILVLLMSAACGAGSSDSGAPVKAQPLSGTIQGKTFTAQSAIARSIGGSTQVTVFSKMVSCMDGGQLMDGEAEILLAVAPWTDGSAYELNLDLSSLSNSKTVTFVVQKGMTPDNLIVGSGRVEVQKAGTMSTNGVLGIRATDSMFGSVEGTIAVQNCN